MLEKKRERALVLSGGGGRGAYHVGALRFLEEHEWFPDIVAGTSIGAVNGAAIASGHNAHSLWALWRRLKTKDVQKARFNFSANYFFDTQPLRETLVNEGWVHFDRVNSKEAAVHLRVTATDVTTGNLHVYGNSSNMVSSSKYHQEPLDLDHIIASCSIPIVYPATSLKKKLFWDGAVVANTPIAPAIDAGAEDLVIVIMTPMADQEDSAISPPNNLLEAISTTLEWALLASYRADRKMFDYVNQLVRLQAENARLQAANRLLLSQVRGEEADFVDANNDNVPDILQKKYREVRDPVIIAPQRSIAVDQILRYTKDDHEALYELGYEDARRAWKRAPKVDGRFVEGEAD